MEQASKDAFSNGYFT